MLRAFIRKVIYQEEIYPLLHYEQNVQYVRRWVPTPSNLSPKGLKPGSNKLWRRNHFEHSCSSFMFSIQWSILLTIHFKMSPEATATQLLKHSHCLVLLMRWTLHVNLGFSGTMQNTFVNSFTKILWNLYLVVMNHSFNGKYGASFR